MKRINATRWMERFAFLGALTLIAVSTACATRDNGYSRFDDATITMKVKSKIAADPQTNPFEVDVDTKRGVVRLSGMVEQVGDRAEMERLARRTKGVVDVINDLEIGDPTVGQVVNDKVIASKVKSKLTADPDINPFRIDVDVQQGVVTLSGDVDDDRTRDEAEKLARDTAGVKRVKNRLTIMDSRS